MGHLGIIKIGNLENRDYSRKEWHIIENNVFEDIMSKSSKNGDMNKARNEFNDILVKSEDCKEKSKQ